MRTIISFQEFFDAVEKVAKGAGYDTYSAEVERCSWGHKSVKLRGYIQDVGHTEYHDSIEDVCEDLRNKINPVKNKLEVEVEVESEEPLTNEARQNTVKVDNTQVQY